MLPNKFLIIISFIILSGFLLHPSANAQPKYGCSCEVTCENDPSVPAHLLPRVTHKANSPARNGLCKTGQIVTTSGLFPPTITFLYGCYAGTVGSNALIVATCVQGVREGTYGFPLSQDEGDIHIGVITF